MARCAALEKIINPMSREGSITPRDCSVCTPGSPHRCRGDFPMDIFIFHSIVMKERAPVTILGVVVGRVLDAPVVELHQCDD